MNLNFKNIINTEEELREIMGHPNEIVVNKTIDYIDDNCRRFIEKAPFITMATSDSDGNFDVSPKGDPAGFVKILNDKTLAIPDRPGNRKADTLTNIIQNPKVGLIFLIPGVRETLRVNGAAKIVTDNEVLEILSCEDKVPSLAIIVDVKEAFMHCAKCIIRSKLWTNKEENNQQSMPTLGKMLIDHSKVDMNPEELDEMIRNDEKTNLY